jgi:hypothetical protein
MYVLIPVVKQNITCIQMFNTFIKIGITLNRDSKGKKHVSGMPVKWTTITKSIYHNEPNYAVLTGPLNDILVIDIDNKGDFPGKEWFENNFFKLTDGLTDTLVTHTISGGYHVYFKYTQKVKNHNDYRGLSIDVLCDRKCAYEGKGYTVISNTNEIKELTDDQIGLLNQRKKKEKTFEQIKEIVQNGNELNHGIDTQKWLITNPRILKKINKHIPTDLARVWEIEIDNNSFKCTPKGHACIVHPGVLHTIENHCTLFINNDGSVVKSCHSHGSQSIARSEPRARALQREIKLVIELQHEETNIYCRLKDDMLDIAFDQDLKREVNGDIYKKVKIYAYTFHMEPKKFLNTIFGGDKEFERHHNNMDNLIKFIKDFDNPQFSFIEANKRYLGFNNGVLDTQTGEFIQEHHCDSSHMTKQYLDIPFSGETDTPLFDSIFDFQLEDNPQKQEIKEFVYFCLGRLFGIRDKYDFTMYLMGEAGCGKSLVIDVMKQFFRDIGAVSSTFEKTFGLAYLYEKDLIVCDDLPKDFSKILPQTIFQTCISGGELSIASKGGSAKTVKWNAPLLFAGNYNPDYVDKGQISRRVLTFEFSSIVPDNKKDTGLLGKISKYELDKIALKCIQTYNKYINDPYLMEKSVWSFCPQYFRENQEELKKDRNPLYKFLSENSSYKKDNIMTKKEIRELFQDWLGRPMRKLDNGTFHQVDSRYEIKDVKICKHCNKEGIKGCCENYNGNERATMGIVLHINIV